MPAASAIIPRRQGVRLVRHAIGLAVLSLCATAAQAVLYEWSGSYVPGETSPSPLLSPDVLRTIDDNVVLNATLTNLSGTVEVFHSIGFLNGNQLTNGGLFDLRADVGTYDAAFGGWLVSTGTLRKSAGTGSSVIGGIGVQSTGLVQALTGSIVFNSGNSFFGGGSSFQGPGEVVVTNAATFADAIASDGSLRLSGGTFTGGGGGAVVSGPLRFDAGRLAGTWVTPAGSTLLLSPGAEKTLNGTLTVQGTLVATDWLGFLNGNTLTNIGRYELQGDVGTFDAAFSGWFVNAGTLVKTAGTGTSTMGGINYAGGGTVRAETGTILFNGYSVQFQDGSRFEGPGEVRVTGAATFVGGVTTDASLRLSGGVFTGSAATVSGPLRFTGGRLDGSWTIPTGSTLLLQPESGKSLNGTLTVHGTVLATDSLGFLNGNTLTNIGRYELQGDVGSFDAAFSGYLVNNGMLVKTAGSGDSTIGGVTFTNTGTVRAETGRIVFNSGANTFGDGSVFQGPGEVLVNSNATFVGAITTDGSLQLAGAAYTGSGGGAVVTGPLRFSGGVLQGTLTAPAGSTWQLLPGTGKALNGTLTVQGTLAATDSLGFLNGNTLNNGGRYELQGDVGTYDAAFSGYLVNNGTLVKTAGSGDSTIGGVTFTNTGTVRAETGRIVFNSGANTFGDGSVLQGPGEVLVNSAATFVGGITTDGSLRLEGGSYTGGGAGAVVAGPLRFSGGVLQGTWTAPAGSTWQLLPGGGKVLNGTLNVQGTVVATDSLGLQNGNALNNTGRVELQGDVGTYDAAFGGVLGNQGTLVKTAGSGTSAISGVTYVGAGTVRAETGTISFNSGSVQFQSGSRFEGPGTIGIDSSAQFQGSFHSDGSLELRGGTFAGSAAVVGGSVLWRSGTLVGQWTVSPASTLRLDGGTGQVLNGTLVNTGTLDMRASLGLQNGNAVTNAAGGVMTLRDGVAVYDAFFGGSVVNQGLLHKTGAGTASFAGIGLTSTGTIAIDAGTLALNQNFAAQGLLDFGLSGPGANGVLAVGGFADLAAGGSVAVHFLGGFTPAVGDVFPVMTYGSRNGNFANTDWTFGDVTFTPIYGDNAFALEVAAVVPEPSMMLMWLAGLALVAARMRRRLRD